MKPTERVNNFVRGRFKKRLEQGNDSARPQNVSSFIQDPEVAAYISKLLDIIDELEARVAKLENRPPIVSAPRSWLAKQGNS